MSHYVYFTQLHKMSVLFTQIYRNVCMGVYACMCACMWDCLCLTVAIIHVFLKNKKHSPLTLCNTALEWLKSALLTKGNELISFIYLFFWKGGENTQLSKNQSYQDPQNRKTVRQCSSPVLL